MKILTRPVLVLMAFWCMAVLLVPAALGADQSTGTMQMQAGPGNGHGSQGNTNQIQAPPSGGQGGSSGQGEPGAQDGSSSQQGSGNGGQMSAPPSDGTGTGNMTAPQGRGGMQGDGNITPPDFSNLTAGNIQGGPGMQGDGNMTPPDFGNLTAGNQTPRADNGMHGNSTQMRHGPGNQSFDNTTAPVNFPDGSDGSQNTASQSGNQPASQAQQQSGEDVIGSLISQLQALLSGKK